VAVAYGVGARSSHYIDSHGIIAATKQAMLDALQELHPPAEYLLIDGRIRLKQSPIPQQAIIRGDSISLSIAAASILAKVTRDRFMIALDGRYPEYGFASHKGYGTEHHRTMLSRLGPTPEHRLTFAPLKATLL
jgi:ribonuclease HII